MIKKGQTIPTSMFILFEIILVILAGVIIYNQVDNIKDGGIFYKKFLAPDLALLTSTIQQVDGNVYYTYNPSEAILEKFDFQFQEDQGTNFIYVDQERYPFASSRDIKPIFKNLKNPSIISITKEGNILKFEKGHRNVNLLAMDCAKYRREEITALTLDPGHGYNEKTKEGDKGKETKSVYESKITKNMAATIRTYVSTVSKTSTRDVKTDDDISMEDRIKSIITPAVLSIHIGENSDIKTNNVIAYINFDSTKKQESMHFACNILNIFSETTPLITGTAIIPVDLSTLPKEDPKQVLLPNIIAVQLEIGNIKNTKNNVLINDHTLLANAVKGAL